MAKSNQLPMIDTYDTYDHANPSSIQMALKLLHISPESTKRNLTGREVHQYKAELTFHRLGFRDETTLFTYTLQVRHVAAR